MKLFSAARVKQWDAYTIVHEPVSSVDLMERAATACVNWLQDQYPNKQNYIVFCGKGNNGGDGLAIARMLIQLKHSVTVYIAEDGKTGTPDFTTNLKKLETFTFSIHTIKEENDFPPIPANTIVIDAIFGTGLNKPLSGMASALAAYINLSGAAVIAIDIPSGLYADSSSAGNIVINAAHTLSFQQYKLAFLQAENEAYCGDVHILDIKLHPAFCEQENAVFNMVDTELIKTIYKPRNKKFAHKGTYGHAAIIAGSYGMMGAAVLSAGACLRSGAGKLTCFIPGSGYQILQTSVPEAMCVVTGEKFTGTVKGLAAFDAVGMGPGLGADAVNSNLLPEVLKLVQKPLVLDADALNAIAANKELLQQVPKNAILTPHPKEFEKLFGKTGNDFERLELALKKSQEYGFYIVLKGHNSFISTPLGKGFFNPTGNAGMATAGSGDVLTGIITGLLAQQYDPFAACILGVYLHGLAGDIAAERCSPEAMLAGDITAHLGDAFKAL